MKCSYKGDLDGIPDPIVHKMLERQVEQGNKKNVSVFEANRTADKDDGGFDWRETPEYEEFWSPILDDLSFDLFFEKYPELAETTQEAQVFERNDELMRTLKRIESKLDQLFAGKGQEVKEQVVKVSDFKPGDRVRVKSWKEVKRLTDRSVDNGHREFDDGGYFTEYDKQFCGMEGVVISTERPYVSTKIDDQVARLHYKALEKL